MITFGRILGTATFGVALLASPSVGWCATSTVAGDVLAVDAATGSIVVGDMGPLQSDGRSEITRRSILVTPSTEFRKVARTIGVAPSGWIGDFVAMPLASSDVRPGDFVAVTVNIEQNSAQAVRVTVVQPSER